MTSRSTFGSIRGIPEDVEKTRTIPFIFSTAERDRHGTVLNQNGWRLQNYRLNPVVVYAHSRGSLMTGPNPDFVIGKATDLIVEGYGSTARLIGNVVFEGPENPLAEKIFRKILFGSLRAASVTFLEIGAGRYGVGDEARYGSKETYYMDGQELLEISIVNIPSNPGAGKRGQKMTLSDPSMAAALIFAATKLLPAGWRPSEVEKLSSEAAELFVQAAELEFYSKDLSVVKKFINDPGEVQIQKERVAYRRERGLIHEPILETDPVLRDIELYRRARGINIKER